VRVNTPSPSGRQHVITLGNQRATIAEVGASVRKYAVDSRDVVLPFAADRIAPAYSGAVLAPWPNRLRDGRYTDAGVEHQLPLTEPGRHVALHGLVAHVRFALPPDDSPTAASVTLEHDLVPTEGYPFPLRVRVTYALSDAGLGVSVTTTNLGTRTAPYGIGFHPWLSPGDARVDECTLRVDAASRVSVDERLLPTGTEPVAGPYDLRTARALDGIALDDAFVDVLRDADGLSWIRLAAPDGRTAAMWMDRSMDTWQVCTGDGIPGIERRGVAAEPMSCIADAFRTGERLIHLAPGASHTVTWGMTLL
jgi:aldose 1-epimerase